MGARGPAPKPTALKVLQGNPGRRPLTQNEPKPRVQRLRCPLWLDPEAQQEWRRLSPELRRLGLLTFVDLAVFAAYCQAYSRWRQAERALSEHGLVMEIGGKEDEEGKRTGAYLQQRPEVSIAQKYHQLMVAAGAKLGLDPSSRSRISVPEPKAEDPFDEFLRGKSG